jgi:hypothetical protein
MTAGLNLDLDYQLKLEPGLDQFGIGLIGAGFIIRDCHLPAYAQAGFRVLGICSRTPGRAEEVAALRGIPSVYRDHRELLTDTDIQVVDIGVPPQYQPAFIRDVVRHGAHIRGILAQKPLAMNLAEAREIVELCEQSGIVLAVNQNMRHDQSVRACKDILKRGWLGEPVLGTIDMRAIPHWMPWQERQGWATLRIMSIHHLDTFRFWFGDPDRIYALVCAALPLFELDRAHWSDLMADVVKAASIEAQAIDRIAGVFDQEPGVVDEHRLGAVHPPHDDVAVLEHVRVRRRGAERRVHAVRVGPFGHDGDHARQSLRAWRTGRDAGGRDRRTRSRFLHACITHWRHRAARVRHQ